MSRRVCLCNLIKEDEIISAIRSGINTLTLIQKHTGAATKCGKCIPILDELIANHQVDICKKL